MSKGNREMKLPELNKFASMTASVSDFKDKVNQLQAEKRAIRETMDNKQEQINQMILEIEEMEKKQE